MILEIVGDLKQNEIYDVTHTDIKYRNTGGWWCEESIHDILKQFAGRNIKITIETLDEDPEEELVTVTYKEILRRCDYGGLTFLGVSPHYLYEGGDPTAIKDLTKKQAMYFMHEEEFAGRCHSEVGA